MQSWLCHLEMLLSITEMNQMGGSLNHEQNGIRLTYCSLPTVASTVNPFYLAPVLQLPQIIIPGE
jgi:hypothetical protein